jgi:tetratricopeptide (TPR) repeat protein
MNPFACLSLAAARSLAGVAALLAIVLISGCSAMSDLARPSGLDKYKSALQHQERNESTLAEQDYKIALRENPDLAEAHLNLAMLYMNSQWWDGADDETQKAVALFEKTHKTYIEGSTWQQSLSIGYNNLGAIEMGRGLESEMTSDIRAARTHWQTGMSHLNKAVQLDPTNAKAQANIQRFKNAYR